MSKSNILLIPNVMSRNMAGLGGTARVTPNTAPLLSSQHNSRSHDSKREYLVTTTTASHNSYKSLVYYHPFNILFFLLQHLTTTLLSLLRNTTFRHQIYPYSAVKITRLDHRTNH